MSDEPRRLIDEAPEQVREAMRSAQLDDPTPTQFDALTARVAFLFPLLPGGGGGGDGGGGALPDPTVAAPAVKGALGLGAFKTTALAVAATVAVGGGAMLTRGRHQVERAEPAAVTAPPAPAKPSQPEQEPEPQEAVVNTPPPPIRHPAPTAALRSEDELIEEAVRLGRSGNSLEALRVAEEHAARFSTGAMAQEREVVVIEALMKLGRGSEARTRADAFRASWPASAHVTKIDALVGE